MNRILIVDDDRTTRHLLQSVLAMSGYSVGLAEDGMAALEVLQAERFDLVLVDVWMPRMNGLELLARLRSWSMRPRVVVMTSDDTPATLLRAVREQAFDVVQKPVETRALLDTVRTVLGSPEVPHIEVISATPEWVELLVPCSREAAERIQAVISGLDARLPAEIRDATAYAFRELLLNAVEWGGKLDRTRSVRIACLRSKRMLMYRIADPGPGFKIDELPHAAIGHDTPMSHVEVRAGKGMRPGGFGLLTVRAAVDELLYNEARNEVVFVKYLTAAGEKPAEAE